MATTRKLTISETGSQVQKPIAVLSVRRIDAVIGSIIQLDGRKSYDPSRKSLTWKWRFVQVPIGSVIDDAGLRDIRPGGAAVSFVPDKTGFYIVELVVSNGETDSDPNTATVCIQLSKVPCGENIVPDARFMWNYISNFWALVEDREIITSIWSSTMQIIGAELIKLWSADYDKSLATIQEHRQRRWQKFSAVSDLTAYADQRIIVGKNDSGARGYTGTPGVRPGSGTTLTIYAPFYNLEVDTSVLPVGSVAVVTKTDFRTLNGNYGANGRVIVVNGQCYTLRRVGITEIRICSDIDGVTATNQLTSASADFVRDKVQLGDRLTVIGGTDAGSYLVSVVDSSTVLTVTHVDGSAVSFAGASGNTYTLDRDFTLANVREKLVPDGEINVHWRIPNLLHIPGLDLENEGVRAGDVIVFEVTRKDSGLSAEIRAQVVGARGSRIGFEFDLNDLVEGTKAYSKEAFRQLVRDLTIVPPSWSDLEVDQAVSAFLGFMPIGVNLNARPFTTYRILFKAKKIIHNTAFPRDASLVSVPSLQETPKDPPVVLRENLDYVVENGRLQFISGIFTPTDPSPEAWWAECAFFDNSQTVENNFGRLVGLLREDFDLKNTKTSYLSAVKGLFYAYTNGPTVANVRLGLQILLGLPFSEERGLVLEVTDNFSFDGSGNALGRMLIEDLDSNDRRVGIRRFYFYPMTVGIETNPATGELYKIGDIVDRFSPLSKGVEVSDYIKDPYWWNRVLYGLEILKFFTFFVSIDSDIFSQSGQTLAFDFLNAIKATYTKILVSALKSFEDDIEIEDALGGHASFTFFDNDWGLEATAKVNDDNHQGVYLFSSDSIFHTRNHKLLKDVSTFKSGSEVHASLPSADMALIRERKTALYDLPYQEGDLLAILPAQHGSSIAGHGVYEILSKSGTEVVLGPASFGKVGVGLGNDSLDEDVFDYGDNLLCSVVRRTENPSIRGEDLVTSSSSNVVTSASAFFISNGVGPGDTLVVESGSNQGEYLVEAIDPFDPGPPQTGPAISETQVRLCNTDGSVPVFVDGIDLVFRVRWSQIPALVVYGAKTTVDSGSTFLEVFGETLGEVIDSFTPGMVNSYLYVSKSDNPVNDGRFRVMEYVHPGKVKIDNPLAVSDTTAKSEVCW